MKNIKKGFTLIELLVVIAIIGILSSVVLASMRNIKVDPNSQVTVSGLIDTYPEATNYAVDAAGVLSVDELADLNARLKALDTSKSQIGVLILQSTYPLSIEEYGIKLAEKWKTGMKGLDNGAIIIVATQDRKVRIEVGYGLEGNIPDAVAGRIIDNDMMPSLKSGDWYNAIIGAINGINSKIK